MADPAGIARMIAARLAASLSSAGAPAPQAAPTPSYEDLVDPNTLADPAARARAIAARLSSTVGSGPSGLLGKRKADDMLGTSGGDKKRKQILLPPNPDMNYMGILIGPKGATQKALEAETGAKIMIRGQGAGSNRLGSNDESEPLHVLVIADSDEAVAKAEAAVNALISDPANALEIKRRQLQVMAMEKMQGGGGMQQGQMMMGGGGGLYDPRRGTSLDAHGLPQPPDQPIGEVVVDPSTGEATVVIAVPVRCVGAVIGKGGETIRDICSSTGTSVTMQREGDMPSGADARLTTVRGPHALVLQAKARVESIIAERNIQLHVHASQGGPGGMGGGPRPDGGVPAGPQLSIVVPDEATAMIIGKGGMTVRGIQARWRVHVNIPRTADATPDPGTGRKIRTIVITCHDPANPMEGGNGARAEIEAIVRNSESLSQGGGANGGGGGGGAGGEGGEGGAPANPPVIVRVPDSSVGMIIGRQGSTVREIQARTGVRVNIPREPEPGSNPPVRAVQLLGPPGACEVAKAEIERIAAGLPNPHGPMMGGPGGPGGFGGPMGPGGPMMGGGMGGPGGPMMMGGPMGHMGPGGPMGHMGGPMGHMGGPFGGPPGFGGGPMGGMGGHPGMGGPMGGPYGGPFPGGHMGGMNPYGGGGPGGPYGAPGPYGGMPQQQQGGPFPMGPGGPGGMYPGGGPPQQQGPGNPWAAYYQQQAPPQQQQHQHQQPAASPTASAGGAAPAEGSGAAPATDGAAPAEAGGDPAAAAWAKYYADLAAYQAAVAAQQQQQQQGGAPGQAQPAPQQQQQGQGQEQPAAQSDEPAPVANGEAPPAPVEGGAAAQPEGSGADAATTA